MSEEGSKRGGGSNAIPVYTAAQIQGIREACRVRDPSILFGLIFFGVGIKRGVRDLAACRATLPTRPRPLQQALLLTGSALPTSALPRPTRPSPRKPPLPRKTRFLYHKNKTLPRKNPPRLNHERRVSSLLRCLGVEFGVGGSGVVQCL